MPNGIVRKRKKLGGATASAEVVLGGRSLHNFASNDYLGLSQRPEIAEAMAEAAREYGVASGGSTYMCGYSELHEQLEHELAKATKQERAIFFSSGYLANIAAVTSLCGKGDYICADRLVHASLIDAILLSKASFSRHSHIDAKALGANLHRAKGRHTMVIAEGVYSMDGDSPPLADYADICAGQDAVLLVDDAHGFGTVGAAGSVAQAGLEENESIVITATLGKAVGASGAFVAGSAAMLDTVAQRARTLIYSTSPPPPTVAAALAALKLCVGQVGDQGRAYLGRLVEHFRHCAAKRNIPLLLSASPIQPVFVPSENEVTRLAGRLEEEGFLVPAIRAPTVPSGKERLRISLSSSHSMDIVESLIDSIATHI
ncbi:MAG: aminotransferase class I/II-fold pyridoxal phosphate-dependent enzyme [Candidatus Porifericomitaceae bacterium WSBS_2022_MAG_OTU9]